MSIQQIVPSNEFYELNDAQRMEEVKKIRKDIINNGSPLLNKMLKVAEKEVIVHIEDFYIHDLKMLEVLPNDSFLWLVRTKGTFLINLQDNSFDNEDNWIPADFTKSVMKQFKVEKYFLIENGIIRKINEKSVHAALAIHADIAYQNKRIRTKYIV